MVAATPRFVRGPGWEHAVEPSVFASFGENLARDYGGTLDRCIALDTLGSEHGQSELRALAMIAATPRFVRGDDWPHAVEPAVFEQFGQDLAQDYRGTLERFLALDAMGSEHARQELRTLRGMLVARGEPTPRALQEGLRLLENTDLRGALATLGKPSLWLAGQRDRLVSARAMQAAAARVPGAQAHVVAQGGHAPFLGHTDEVATQLQHFVAALS